MSETSNENSSQAEPDLTDQQQAMVEMDEERDARADGDGLAAEAGAGEETGLAQG